jgi:Sigma-54 interaction domain
MTRRPRGPYAACGGGMALVTGTGMHYDVAACSVIFSRFSVDFGYVPPRRPPMIPEPSPTLEVLMARARPSSLPDPLDRPVGAAPALQISCAQIRHLARFDAVGHGAVPTVLLPGEAGTGKGLVARVIHDSGPRAQGSFIEVNCAAIPDTLLEVELFGVEAGAFTDAKRAKPSLCEAASGGTLFLEALAGLWMIHEARGSSYRPGSYQSSSSCALSGVTGRTQGAHERKRCAGKSRRETG